MGKRATFFVILAAILLPTVWLTINILSADSIQCEVCMEFRGRSQCRKASGPNREACQQTATDNACAFLASGMTDSISCAQRIPTRIQFGDEPQS